MKQEVLASFKVKAFKKPLETCLLFARNPVDSNKILVLYSCILIFVAFAMKDVCLED